MIKAGLTIVTLTLWLFLGLGGKALRYFVPQAPANSRAIQAMNLILAEQGWVPLGANVASEKAALESFSFEKQGCSQPLHLAFIGFGDATLQVLRNGLGADLAFVQEGVVTDAPNFEHQRETVARHSVERLLGRKTSPDLPIVVLYPKKFVLGAGENATGCTADISGQWPRLQALIALGS